MTTPTNTSGSRRPLVNVIVPTFNRPRRLRLSLASIHAQDGLGEGFDIEPIVVDDGSSEPVEEIARSFPGSRYIRLKTNRGLAAARNAGLAEATGDYVAFLDDDDLWLPHRLLAQVTAVETAAEAEIAYGRYVVCSHDGPSYVDPPKDGPSGLIFDYLLKQDASNLFTMLIPKAVLDKVGGFDESLPVTGQGMVWGIETDLVLRVALGFPFRYVPGVVTVIVPSTADHRDPEVHRKVLLQRQERILALVQGQPSEAEVTKIVSTVTPWHVVRRFRLAGDDEGAHRELLTWLEDVPELTTDPWARSRVRETISQLALASDSPIETAKSLCAEVRRLGGARDPATKALLADVWTTVAMGLASGRRRDDRKAASAAARAILQDPRKPMSRPGLLRLLTRLVASRPSTGTQRAS